MNTKNAKAVLFDCWDTVISFREKTHTWNIEPLRKHCLNSDKIDFGALERFSDDFLKEYLFSKSHYEITAEQFLNLLVTFFHLELDVSIEECVHEILFYLLPDPMPGLLPFLEELDKDGIPYAILSNTIYDEKDTFDIVKTLLPQASFRFLLGSSSVGIKKPFPLFFRLGMDKIGVDPDHAIYIGDSFFADVLGSNKAGMKKAVWLNTKKKDLKTYLPYLEEDIRELRFVECRDYQDVLALYRKGELL